ncbi:BGTF surface domain-containing protein [Halobellus rufus]|uniref:BGTF surface domain-containing protein n=1 Tax=Halobellus rufus TaxID=1448860 RepID=UPI0006799B1D|nr:BGTF surface domain-containing protein [Halobellus rufus]
MTALALVAALAVAAVAAVGAPVAAQSGDAPVELETDAVESVQNATVSGTSTLDAGTEIQVRLSSTGETSPQFLKTRTTTVGSDGDWNATVDLSAIEEHDSVGVSVVVASGDDDRGADFEIPIENDRTTPAETGDSPVSAPGFGSVVAIVALVGSAALVRTRR